ncbi:MAG: hypothetical protein ACE5K9_08050 [Candidatus Methylomirabilales bacterium]
MLIGFGRPKHVRRAWGAAVVVALGLSWPLPADGWGLEAHVLINRAACTTLPQPLRPFFMRHQAFIGEHGKDPDTVLTIRDGEAERIRHWFDLDELDRFPFKQIPRNTQKALAKYGRQRLEAAGLLPWRIAELYTNLVRAMRDSNWRRVPLLAAHLGHYVADGHQPLHTTTNYDGQLTGNRGIHKRFENEMIHRHLGRYQDLAAFTQPAQRAADPVAFTFDFLVDSHVWVDNLLRADTLAKRGVRDYDDAYYAALHAFAGKLAKLSMAQAATDIGSLWYSAWVEAGRPNFP